MRYLASLFVVLTSTLCFSCATINFLKLCKNSDMTYSMPDGFRPVEVKINPDLAYQFAVKHKNKKLEIRYSIVPLKKEAEAYNRALESSSKSKIALIDPNLDHELLALTAVMNISRSEKTMEFNSLKPDSVAQNLNADWGASYYIENNSAYGKGYAYSLVIAAHKKDIANAFIVYLFDDEKEIHNEMSAAFYNLKFK